MKLKQFTIEGVYSYKKKQTLNLEKLSTVLITGQKDSDELKSNGAGKSSLFESLGINFFGIQAARAKTLDETINDESETAYTESIVEIDNTDYRKIKQWGKKKRNELHIKIDGTWKPFAKASEADSKWIELLGINPQTFFSIIFWRQKGTLQFIEGTASDRKEILRDLLNLQIYEDACKKASEKKVFIEDKIRFNKLTISKNAEKIEKEQEYLEDHKDLKEDIATTKINIKTLDKKLKSYQKKKNEFELIIEQNKQRIDEKRKTEEKIDETELEIKEEKVSLENAKNDFFTIISNITSKKKLNNSIKDKIKDLKIEQESFSKFNDSKLVDIKSFNIVSLREKFISITNEISEEKVRLDIVNENLKDFSSLKGICPVLKINCQSLDYKSNNKYVQKLKSEANIYESKISQLNEAKNSLMKKIKGLEKEIEDAEKLNEQIIKGKNKFDLISKDIGNLKNNIYKNDEWIQASEKTKSNVQKNIMSYEKNMKKNRRLITQLKEKLKELSDFKVIDQEKYETLNKIFKETELALKNEQNDLDIFNQEIGNIKATLQQIKEFKEENNQLELNNKESRKRLSVFTKLSKAFGKNGIQKSIMKKTVPELERITNNLLKVFCPYDDIKVKFDLDPKTKSGTAKIQGGLDIIIEEKGIPKNISLYSGGETTRITFSILLGLSELLSQRAGKKMETLIIDERISGLDENGIYQFAEIINLIKKRYEKLIVITHIPQLKDLFNQIVKINKTDEGSLICQ